MNQQQRKQFQRRMFRCYEICAFKLGAVVQQKDPQGAFWDLLRELEPDEDERLQLGLLVKSFSKYYGYKV